MDKILAEGDARIARKIYGTLKLFSTGNGTAESLYARAYCYEYETAWLIENAVILERRMVDRKELLPTDNIGPFLFSRYLTTRNMIVTHGMGISSKNIYLNCHLSKQNLDQMEKRFDGLVAKLAKPTPDDVNYALVYQEEVFGDEPLEKDRQELQEALSTWEHKLYESVRRGYATRWAERRFLIYSQGVKWNLDKKLERYMDALDEIANTHIDKSDYDRLKYERKSGAIGLIALAVIHTCACFCVVHEMIYT